MLPSETMIWQPEFTDKTLSRKPGAVHLSTLSLCDCVHCLLLACQRRAICSKESCKSGTTFLALFCSQGSIPAEISFRASSRFARASERETSGYTPSARVFSLPKIR
ncbi:hypothetical protein AML59_06700 [Escherichia coli]|nr:hypothetical protein AML59_06700 [Escherichia coli]